MNINNKKVITAVTVAAIAIFALAGCSSTATKATTAAPKPTASASAAPSKTASADEVKAKTISKVLTTAGGNFSPCTIWVPIGATSGTPTYTKGAACVLLPDFIPFAAPNGDPIVCNPIANGDAALGIIYTGSNFKCTYTVPVGE